MAGTNVTTGKIVGCKPGTLTYRHEKAHKIYNDSVGGIRNGIWIGDLLLLTIGSILASLFFPNTLLIKLIAAIFFLVMLLLKMYEEIWCWVWAVKHR